MKKKQTKREKKPFNLPHFMSIHLFDCSTNRQNGVCSKGHLPNWVLLPMDLFLSLKTISVSNSALELKNQNHFLFEFLLLRLLAICWPHWKWKRLREHINFDKFVSESGNETRRMKTYNSSKLNEQNWLLIYPMLLWIWSSIIFIALII